MLSYVGSKDWEECAALAPRLFNKPTIDSWLPTMATALEQQAKVRGRKNMSNEVKLWVSLLPRGLVTQLESFKEKFRAYKGGNVKAFETQKVSTQKIKGYPLIFYL